MAVVLPGVKVGPLDPDRTADFGQVSAKNSARTLIRHHAASYPQSLTQALAKKLDEARSKALYGNLGEVEAYLRGFKLGDGSSALPDGAVLEGAQVRGERDREQILTFTYRIASGRSVKWWAPYDRDELPEAAAEGDENVALAEARERGVAIGFGDAHTESLLRENARLRAQLDSGAPAPAPAPEAEAPEGDGDGDGGEPDAEKDELTARIAELEAQLAEAQADGAPEGDGDGGDGGDGEQPSNAAAEPPFEGYDDVGANDLKRRVKAGEWDAEALGAILAYESTHANRSGVKAAIEAQLGNAAPPAGD